MCSEVIMWWDEERIIWYRNAAADSAFHSTLTDEIKKHITKDEDILELGCGLGYVAELLYKQGYSIRATDNDKKAIEEAISRSGLDIYSVFDADSEIPETDTLLLIFFGNLPKNLKRYLSAAKKIIYVISEHRGQSDELRKKVGGVEKTEHCLKKNRVDFSRIQLVDDFSQPLSTTDEAERYIEKMYGEERKEEYMKFLQKTDNGLIFPNKKHVSIFIINNKGGRK